MDLKEKLEILSASARYDASCASSFYSNNKKIKSTIPGICHSWSADGRCISLLKILMTNICEFDCAYCINRKSNSVKRAYFTPDEICKLTTEFYKRNYIEGLFLSSAVMKNPNYTMEIMIQTIKKLREEYFFKGYIHLKIIPGSDEKLIQQAIKYADRISINIEFSDSQKLFELTEKKKEMILKPMKYARDVINEEYKNKFHGGQSTQLIVGAIDETDRKILNLSQHLYSKINLKRVYYSAFINVNSDPRLASFSTPILREHRLYQADWLIRVYGFRLDEIFGREEENLKKEIDPKTYWALKNYNLFPLEITKASYEELIRVPGIGIRGAKKIINERRYSTLDINSFKKLRINMKKAINFITLNGKFYGKRTDNPQKLINELTSNNYYIQDNLFDLVDKYSFTEANTGEL